MPKETSKTPPCNVRPGLIIGFRCGAIKTRCSPWAFSLHPDSDQEQLQVIDIHGEQCHNLRTTNQCYLDETKRKAVIEAQRAKAKSSP